MIRSFYLTEDLNEQIKSFAKEQERSESSLIRLALKQFVKNIEEH